MQIKTNWDETYQMFDAWWSQKSTGRPMLNIWAKRSKPLSNPFAAPTFDNLKEQYFNTEKVVARHFERFCTHEPLAEAFPGISLDLGAGSLALYVGCEPYINVDSLWFETVSTDYSQPGFPILDENNKWLKTHIEMFQKAKEMVKDTDARLCIPDLVENLDILSSLRSTTTLCFDIYDNPDGVKSANERLNRHFETCFDAFNCYCADEAGRNAFTAFHILGQGRTAKIQCDIAAMLSPEQFQEFSLPWLEGQCGWLDNSMFHLDGPECLCHVPALMKIKELNALQWTPGLKNPFGGEECWDDLYRQVKEADKGCWVWLGDYEPKTAISKADRLVRKFGGKGFYFIFPQMERDDAELLLKKADTDWVC